MQDNRKREIRSKADSFRVKCRVSRYGIIDLFKECERLEYKLFRYPLGENADLGFTVKKDDDIIIFTNSCSRLSREIFTLAHGIGHYILETIIRLLKTVSQLMAGVLMRRSRKQIILQHVY